MNHQAVQNAMEEAFSRDVRDGTVDIKTRESSAILDGGNWSLCIHSDGTIGLDLPMNDANYFDDDPNIFLENVLSLEVEHSLAMLDESLEGALVEGLRLSGETWSEALASRIVSMRG